jgi:hypothetical protein
MKVNISDFQTDPNAPQDALRLYTLNGQEAYLDEGGFPRVSMDTDKVFAKAIKNKKSKTFGGDYQYRFYIKTDPNKKVFNPIELYSIQKANPSFLNKVCKSETVFTEVSESIFNQYINFLKTRQTQWLNSTQRELR